MRYSAGWTLHAKRLRAGAESPKGYDECRDPKPIQIPHVLRSLPHLLPADSAGIRLWLQLHRSGPTLGIKHLGLIDLEQ